MKRGYKYLILINLGGFLATWMVFKVYIAVHVEQLAIVPKFFLHFAVLPLEIVIYYTFSSCMPLKKIRHTGDTESLDQCGS